MKKNKKAFAKTAKEETLVGDYEVIIGEEKYEFFGMCLAEVLFEVLDSHIMNDKSFTNWMTVVFPNHHIEQFFVPALLCGFNFISVQEMLSYSSSGTLEETLQEAKFFEDG